MSETCVDPSSVGVWRSGAVVDQALRFIEADAAFAELVGAEPGQLLGQPVAARLPQFEASLREVLASGQAQSRVLFDSSGNGRVALRLDPLRTSRGTIAGVELLVEPADQVWPAPADQSTLEAPSVRAVLDGLFAFAGVLLPDGTLIEANRAALEAANLSPADVLDKPFADTFWWSYDPVVQDELRQAITRAVQGEVVRYDVPVRLAGNTLTSIDFMLAPARDAQGRVQYLIASAIDISERARTEAALQASETRFRATFDHAPVGIAHVGLDGRWLHVNRQLCSIVGYPYAELLDCTFQSITHPDDLTVDLALVERLLAGDLSAYDLEKRYLRKDGSIVWVRLTVALVRTADGAPDYFISIVEDINQRKLAETELRFQAQLLDAVGQGVIATDFDGTVRYWNDFAEQLYGWSRDEAMGRNILDLVATDLSLRQGQEIMALLQRGQRWAGQYFVSRRDGSIFPAFVTDTPLYGPDGSVVGIVGVSSDISEQIRLEAEREELLLRERATRTAAERTAARINQLQAVTAALSEALTPREVAEVIVSRSLNAVGGASSTLRLISPDGESLDTLYSAGVPAQVVETWNSIPLEAAIPVCVVARTGQALYFENRAALSAAYPQMVPIISPLGYEAFAIVSLSIEGRTIGSLALTFSEPRSFSEEDRDVLLAMASQAAQAIERARLYDAAREAVEVRDSFIAVASHDLRTPITTLLGQAQLLERRAIRAGLDAQLINATRIIANQAQHLNRMVSALLDLSRIQSGQLTIDVTPVDLAALAARMVAVIQPTLSRHSLEISGEAQGLWVAGDEVRLEQVLANLIGNAVKYSPHGGTVRVQVARQPREACIAVSDEGIGIPAEARTRLFERFYRAANAQASGISGIGIGLYAVREILTLHRGTVAVESQEGVGSTFTISLPLPAQDPA